MTIAAGVAARLFARSGGERWGLTAQAFEAALGGLPSLPTVGVPAISSVESVTLTGKTDAQGVIKAGGSLQIGGADHHEVQRGFGHRIYYHQLACGTGSAGV